MHRESIVPAVSPQNVLTTADADEWRRALPADVCVMGSLEYARIIERHCGFAARLFVLETEQSSIAYPFFVRPIGTLPFVKDDNDIRLDTFTPEYTGPLFVRSDSQQNSHATGFAEQVARYCRDNGIVAEFAHLSPWHDFGDLLDPACVMVNRDIVQVDLTLGEAGLWTKSLTSDTRRQTRQAEKAGVRVRWSSSLDDVRAFYCLHAGTMDRRQAKDCYRIPLEYFVAIFESMPDHAFMALAEYQGRVVAGGLYFHGGTDVYWHLSAVDLEFANVRPVNKYVWETLLWAVGAGKQRMLLGGGYKPDDGVFRFKAGFSPLRARFSTYQRIHDAHDYKDLIDAWSAYYGVTHPCAGFFPAYRSTPDES
jgi:hypothetical protein